MSTAPGARRSRSSLAIIERAFRGSLEEQYGHIAWLSRVMHRMGAVHALLLKGDTVLYARSGQPRIALTIGDTPVTGVSHHESGVAALLAAHVPVYAWAPDMARLRLPREALLPGIVPTGEDDMPALIRRFDAVWYW